LTANLGRSANERHQRNGTPREKQLLGNVLDALDRLFDWRSSVIDEWMLLFATAEGKS